MAYLPANYGGVRANHELDWRRSALREPWQLEEKAAAGRGKKVKVRTATAVHRGNIESPVPYGSKIRYRAMRIHGPYRPQKADFTACLRRTWRALRLPESADILIVYSILDRLSKNVASG